MVFHSFGKFKYPEKPVKSRVYLPEKSFCVYLTGADDLGRVVIPKEIRRTMRIREGDPSQTTLTPFDKFCWAIHSVVNRYKEQAR